MYLKRVASEIAEELTAGNSKRTVFPFHCLKQGVNYSLLNTFRDSELSPLPNPYIRVTSFLFCLLVCILLSLQHLSLQQVFLLSCHNSLYTY